jgi:hypothetical protein
MEISVINICQIFRDLLSGRISREQADRWAYSVIQNEESGILTFSPPSDRQRIWAGVMYLYGVDLLVSPGVYLHSDDDIREEMNSEIGCT